ncbi:MAG: AMP-binding protein [Deltaproteobacteria bacterium]|nr:AMP-binding protein [Deltaproteobacteria bacterium]
MLITDILARNAGEYADEVSLVERDPAIGRRRELTWKAFAGQAHRVADALGARGVRKGDKAAILLVNSLEWLPIYFGILAAGAWAVPLNFRFSSSEILRCLEVSEAKVLFYGPEFRDRIREIRDHLSAVEAFLYVGDEEEPGAERLNEVLVGAREDVPGPRLTEADEAALYFTSGTTGQPKPILLTHGNLAAACLTEHRHHRQRHGDNFICIPPLYHTGAKMHWFGNLLVGARAVILRGVSPRWILEAVSEEQGTIVWLLVPWAQDILTAIETGDLDPAAFRLDQWRLMHIGAQPVPPSLVRRWLARFPGHAYDTNYGLSEATGPGCVHLGLENVHRVGSIGRPGFGWEARIVGDGGDPLAPGAVGELAVRGPGVMKEYYRNPAATAQALRDGWLFTGDMARIDEDGFVWLVDRKKDVIITGGENIFPVEIEDFLRAHPDVRDAAVIGLPDPRLGEVPVAVVERQPWAGEGPDDLLSYCDALPRYKRPRAILYGEVPRNPTGKIEKPRLRERYAGTRGAFTPAG